MTSRMLLLGLGLGLVAGTAVAGDQPTPTELLIKDHRFSPAEIRLPAGKPAVIVVRNEDTTAEEVESTQLQIEKVVPAGAQSRIRLSPLETGRYLFMGEFHPETAQGVVIAE